MALSSGSFNVSVQNVTYRVVASSSGYASYYSNFSLNQSDTKNLTVNLKQLSKPSTLSSTELYAIIGAGVAIAVIGSAVALNRKRK